jgi:hypothetical protein
VFELPALPNPELFFGICSPIGVGNTRVYNILQEALKKYDYSSQYFKVTKLLQSIILPKLSLVEEPLEKR